MAIETRILADSIAPCGRRLTTRLWKYPRSIHSEIMTHAEAAKNAASSRAIPTEKLLDMVWNDPFVPQYIGKNQKGMQAGEELSDDDKAVARDIWLECRQEAIESARRLLRLNIHKQVVNRLIEPWMWITIVISTTQNDNIWGLRCHKDAEPHFQDLAYKDRDMLAASTPRKLAEGEWHLPFIDLDQDFELASKFLKENPDRVAQDAKYPLDELLKMVSAGRCARVSYLTHDGRRSIEDDLALHDRLAVQQPLHATPMEHPAQAMDFPAWFDQTPGLTLDELQIIVAAQRAKRQMIGREPFLCEMINETVLAEMRSGRFWGWRQYRKTLKNEYIGAPAL